MWIIKDNKFNQVIGNHIFGNDKFNTNQQSTHGPECKQTAGAVMSYIFFYGT